MDVHNRTGHILRNNDPVQIRKDLQSAGIFKAFLRNFYVILKTLAEPFGFPLPLLEWLSCHFFFFRCPKVLSGIVQELDMCALHQK